MRGPSSREPFGRLAGRLLVVSLLVVGLFGCDNQEEKQVQDNPPGDVAQPTQVTVQGVVDDGMPNSRIPGAQCQLTDLAGNALDPAVTFEADEAGRFEVMIEPDVLRILSCHPPGKPGAVISRIADTSGLAAGQILTEQDVLPQTKIIFDLIMAELAENPDLDVRARLAELQTGVSADTPDLPEGELRERGQTAAVLFEIIFKGDADVDFDAALDDLLADGTLDDPAFEDIADEVNDTVAFTAKFFTRIKAFPICSQIDANCDTDAETVAEIAAVSSDGMTVIYTDGKQEALGFVDITDPANPMGLGTLALPGEPTSVAVTGNYALAGVNTSADFINVSGQLVIVDIASRTQVASLDLGGQPDSVAVSPDGRYAAVVIENERDEDLGDGAPPQLPAGELVIVDLVGAPAAWTTRRVAMTGTADLFPTDPEPEYVDINANNVAVVTLQENNYLVLVDLTTGAISNDFSAGTVDLEAIDTLDNGFIKLVNDQPERKREPDGVTWLDNRLFVTADEGDLEGGSRTFTVFDDNGTVIYSPGNSLEHEIVRIGHYPDKRSDAKGAELENADYGRFGGFDRERFLFVASERASVIAVYSLQDLENPELTQILPAGVGPEGVLAIPSRNLLIAASEEDARGDKIRSVLNIYQYGAKAPNYPTLMSANRADGTPIPWGAQSGLAASLTDPNTVYSVQDSFYQRSRVFQIDIGQRPAEITDEIVIKDSNDVFANFDVVQVTDDLANDDPARIDVFDSADLAAMINADKTVNLDPEGIAVINDGFVIAHEGNGTVGDAGRPVNSQSLLFRTNMNGVIQEVVGLPADVAAKQIRFGFEGVAVDDDKVYVAFQRAWAGETQPRIGIYDPDTQAWSFLFYPLDMPESQNGGWVGLSEITALGNGNFLVVERDNQGGPDAAIKRLYAFSVMDLVDGDTVTKILVDDLMDDLAGPNGLIAEKIEGAAVLDNGNVLIINDNDGVDDSNGETQLLNLGDLLSGVNIPKPMVAVQGSVQDGVAIANANCVIVDLNDTELASFTADATGAYSVQIPANTQGVVECSPVGQANAQLNRYFNTMGLQHGDTLAGQDVTPHSSVVVFALEEELGFDPQLDLDNRAAALAADPAVQAQGDIATTLFDAILDDGGNLDFAAAFADLLADGSLDDGAFAAIAGVVNGAVGQDPRFFSRIKAFPVCSQLDPTCDTDTETVAEIVAASTDGMTLIYTDGKQQALGFVDITDPANPMGLGTLALPGEPTSVAVVGGHALAGVNTSADFVNVSGQLVVADITSRTQVMSLDLGGQPDSVAVSPDGRYAVIAIENERDEDLGDGAPPQLPAGDLVIVDLVGDPADWTLRRVDLTGTADLFPTDPEPEYVDINADNLAVVTLQENNYIALIDLASGTVVNDFSAGSVDLDQIDTLDDGFIDLVNDQMGRKREPDGVSWMGNTLFATADEGDLEGGSRTFTIFDRFGTTLFSPGNSLEHEIVRIGHYPDKRSDAKGVEPENAEFGRFGTFNNERFLFVASERASVIAVYSLADPTNPELVQILPAGVGPEGVLAIPSRNLLIAASEEDARGDKIRSVLNIYQYGASAPTYPTLVSANRMDGTPIPWGAQSGLAKSLTESDVVYSVQDSFYAKSRVFRIDVGQQPALITDEIVITDADGVFTSFPVVSVTPGLAADDPARIDVFDSEDLAAMINADGTVNLDPEGIMTFHDDDTGEDNFVIAHEGNGTVGDDSRPVNSANLLIRTDLSGVIKEVVGLPAEINAKQIRFGFEGVTYYDEKAYVAFQRAWSGDAQPRIGVYQGATDSWQFFFYPLDAPESQNGGWVGLSELTALGNGNFMVVERDNQGGPDAAIKRLYAFNVNGLVDGDTVTKVLIDDLMDNLAGPNGLIPEKIEGATVLDNGDVLIVNDNDGVDDSNGETELLDLGDITDTVVASISVTGIVDDGTPTSAIPGAQCSLVKADGGFAPFNPHIGAVADGSGSFAMDIAPGVVAIVACRPADKSEVYLLATIDTRGVMPGEILMVDVTPQNTLATGLALEEAALDPNLDMAMRAAELQGSAAAPDLPGELKPLGDAAAVAFNALAGSGLDLPLQDLFVDLFSDGVINAPAFDGIAAEINGAIDNDLIARLADAFRPMHLQLLHFSDIDGIGGVGQVEGFAALVEHFRDELPDNTLFLSSGDNWIPGPEYAAAADASMDPLLGAAGAGRANVAWLNAMGVQASAVGNHDLDNGPNEFAQLLAADGNWPGASFPYLSANLDFGPTADGAVVDPSDLVVADGLPAVPGTLAGSTTIEVGGRTIGVIGASTPKLGQITSTGAIGISPADSSDIAGLAAIIQTRVDALEAQGVNKIILLAHMQQLAIEQQLATLLSGVDVIVGGGSNTLLADGDDLLRDGDSAADTYPLEFNGADGKPVLVVNTDGDYKYLGRLVVNFDSRGELLLSSLDEAANGAYAGIDSVLTNLGVAAGNTQVDDITDGLRAVLAAKEGNVAGLANVYLDGNRESVRTEESNMGNLSADANLWAAQQFDPSVQISLKNGGGIRAPIGRAIYPPGSTDGADLIYEPNPEIPGVKPAGGISQLDIENTLRFNNGLSLVTATAAELQTLIEHAVSATVAGATPGQFPQVAGIRFSFDYNLPAGSRVRSLAVLDEAGAVVDAVVVDGMLVGDPDRTFRMVALNFLVGGGDGYPFPALSAPNRVNLYEQMLADGNFTFATAGTEQDALAEYLNTFHGEVPYNLPEVPIADDRRIQNLTDNGGIDSVFDLRVATFNASLNRYNQDDLVAELLGDPADYSDNLRSVAEIIQRVDADVILINEFDYDAAGDAAGAFQALLEVPQLFSGEPGNGGVKYPYAFSRESNTGIDSGLDLDNNGSVGGANDAFGFGYFPGQYGMLVLSKYPILENQARTFQKFLWKDMPNALLPADPNDADGNGDVDNWYTAAELDAFRLSSKSHWDLPVQVGDEIIHVLASHPTPPVFDGDEDRNGTRNHDEVRFWADYIDPANSGYIYDDAEFAAAGDTTPVMPSGGLAAGAHFVILGDQNADVSGDGDATNDPMARIFTDRLAFINAAINSTLIPAGQGGGIEAALQGAPNDSHVGNPANDTADFSEAAFGGPGNVRVDYVIPSINLAMTGNGVFWPASDSPLFPLTGPGYPAVSSDHRAVWVDLDLKGNLGLTPAPMGTLFFSEYIEGGSFNKALEIYNGTGADIDLSDYELQLYSNGNSAPNATVALSGILANGEVFVAAHASADPAILAEADLLDSSVVNFNGDDAVALVRIGSGDYVDVIGQIGLDPGSEWGTGDQSTKDNTIRRDLTTLVGDSDPFDAFDPAAEWDGFAKDTLSGIGSIGTGGGGGGTGPMVCGDAANATFIYSIQGNGDASPLEGQSVEIEGIVVADFQGDDGQRGFYLQEEDTDADGDPSTSDGIFVYEGAGAPAVDVSVGDQVRVAGTVAEYLTLTELSPTTEVLVCASGVGGASAAAVTLPEMTEGDLESVEGMLVALQNDMVVAQNYFLGRYGQMTLASPDDNAQLTRMFQPTNVLDPTDPGIADLADENARRLLVLDDGSGLQNPAIVPYLGGPLPTALDVVRGGDTVSNLVGVIDYGSITSSGIRDYRLQPTQAPTFTTANPRTANPDAVGGSLKVASFNVLNYFNGDGLGGGFPTSRGADTASEFERQSDKIVAAIIAMDADVIGLMEIENDGFNGNSAIAELVNRLNAVAGVGTYDFVNPGTAGIGSDEIAVGFLYRTATVSLDGAAVILDDNGFVDSNNTGQDRNRAALVQTFVEISSGEGFTAVVNHLKSKGSSCGAGDDDALQGSCNETRRTAAAYLANWLATDPTGSGDADFLIIGDLNSYAEEDPIHELEGAGYTNLVEQFQGSDAYTYTFDGLVGYLDHALANADLSAQVTGVTAWPINTDEPTAIDYDETYNPAGYYEDHAYRSSDHDPVVIGLNLGGDAAAGELFISEYIEGSSFNKAMEIYNGTGASVDLSAYELHLFSNGNAVANGMFGLSGMLADGDVVVIAHPSADAAILAEADLQDSSAVNWNGDDAVALVKGGQYIDVIGQIGTDPGSEWGTGDQSTKDNTIRRSAGVSAGDTNGADAFDPATEWQGFAQDTFDGLGSHTTH